MSSQHKRPAGSSSFNPEAFTLVELLVVIGIIALLVSILIPVIGRVRRNAYAADTKNFISQLGSAIERYQGDLRAYPGPIPNDGIYNTSFVSSIPYFSTAPKPMTAALADYDTNFDSTKITGTENLVLGLLGGLTFDTTQNAIVFNPSFVGRGPNSLNQTNPKNYTPYVDNTHLSTHLSSTGLKTGLYSDEGCPAILDTNIPEFVDSFPESMPILYLRAKSGSTIYAKTLAGYNSGLNSVVTNGQVGAPPVRAGAYDISQVVAYTASYKPNGMTPAMDPNATTANHAAPSADYFQSVGTGKQPPRYYVDGLSKNVGANDVPFPYHGLRTVDVNSTGTPGPTSYQYPLDAFPYIENPAAVGTARQKDSYILISAGLDRIYGTADDIVSFGTVGE